MNLVLIGIFGFPAFLVLAFFSGELAGRQLKPEQLGALAVDFRKNRIFFVATVLALLAAVIATGALFPKIKICLGNFYIGSYLAVLIAFQVAAWRKFAAYNLPGTSLLFYRLQGIFSTASAMSIALALVSV